MATYILLLNLTPEGRANALRAADYMLDIERTIDIPGVSTMGLYAVLGPYDFVSLVEAPGNEAIAKFSIELGVKAGVQVTTLPVIPASSLEELSSSAAAEVSAQVPPRPSTLDIA